MDSSPVAVTQTSDMVPVSSKEFLNLQATIGRGFTLKRVLDMIRTYSQIQFKFIKQQWIQSTTAFYVVLNSAPWKNRMLI